MSHTLRFQRETSVAPDAPVFMMYTSGTTGVPKDVVHRHNVNHLVSPPRALRLQEILEATDADGTRKARSMSRVAWQYPHHGWHVMQRHRTCRFFRIRARTESLRELRAVTRHPSRHIGKTPQLILRMQDFDHASRTYRPPLPPTKCRLAWTGEERSGAKCAYCLIRSGCAWL